MVLLLVFHEGDALSHYGTVNYHHGPFWIKVFVKVCPPQALVDLLKVISIGNVDDIPARSLVFVSYPYRHDLFGVSPYLEVIAVYYADKILEPILGGKAPGLSHLPLLLLPVSHKAVSLFALISAKPFRKGKTIGCRQALAKVPGVPFHAWNPLFNMTSKGRAGPSEFCEEVLFGEVAVFTKDCIHPWRDVSYAHHQFFPFFPVRVSRVVPHYCVKEQKGMKT